MEKLSLAAHYGGAPNGVARTTRTHTHVSILQGFPLHVQLTRQLYSSLDASKTSNSALGVRRAITSGGNRHCQAMP